MQTKRGRYRESSPYFDLKQMPTKLYQQESTRGVISPQQSSILSGIIPQLKQMVSQIEACSTSHNYGEIRRTPNHKRFRPDTEERLQRLAASVQRCQYELFVERSERRKLERELHSAASDLGHSQKSMKLRETGKFTMRYQPDLAAMPTMPDLTEPPVEREVGKLRKKASPRGTLSHGPNHQPLLQSPPIKPPIRKPLRQKQVPTVDIEVKQLVARLQLQKTKLQHTQSSELRKRLRQDLISLSRQIHDLTKQKSQRYRNVQS